MILHTFTLDIRCGNVRRDGHDTYQMHVTVEHLTRNLPAGEGRLLWAQPERETLLVQAGAAIESAPPGYTLRSLGTVRTAFAVGEVVRWGLIANPVKAIVLPRGVDGRRPEGQPTRRRVIPEPERNAWMARKLQPALTIGTMSGAHLWARVGLQRTTGDRLCHVQHVGSGTAVVSDPDALRDMILQGVGAAKAFGCGLLLVGGEGS